MQEYSSSDKAKDALYNVGFCYEKLGQFDKMAAANEQYCDKYPDEKDVEGIMLRSAAYYTKAAMLEKAMSVYHTFINRFPVSPHVVEAYYMIAKCADDQGSKDSALVAYAQVEHQNTLLAKANIQADNYHAAEAAYFSGLIRRGRFLALHFTGEASAKQTLHDKSELLAAAAGDFQRVIEYRSERMFEAAFRIGQLYEDLANGWNSQERAPLDPIKSAVREKEIQTVASGLLQKSFIPFMKTLQAGAAFDSLTAEQKSWIAKSDTALQKNMVDAGVMLWAGVAAMRDAPVPKEISDKPLANYQYRKRLCETVVPMEQQVRAYYASAFALADSVRLAGHGIDSCRAGMAFVNFTIGDDYNRLTAEILQVAKNPPPELSKEEAEDLTFQLQDIGYELQDKAIFSFEDALKWADQYKLQSSQWTGKIIQSLARLNPAKYGAAYYRAVAVASDSGWLCREDSAAGWNAAPPPADGWYRAVAVRPSSRKEFQAAGACAIWGVAASAHQYFWKNVFFAGAPRSAEVRIVARLPYRLFINGTLMLSDTAAVRDTGAATAEEKADSAVGIVSILKGGDNCIAVEVNAPDTLRRSAAVLLSVLVDTSEHYAASLQAPAARPLAALVAAKRAAADSVAAATAHAAADSAKRMQQAPPGSVADTAKPAKNAGAQTGSPQTPQPQPIPAMAVDSSKQSPAPQTAVADSSKLSAPKPLNAASPAAFDSSRQAQPAAPQSMARQPAVPQAKAADTLKPPEQKVAPSSAAQTRSIDPATLQPQTVLTMPPPRTRDEALRDIEGLRQREIAANNSLRQEAPAIPKLRAACDSVDTLITQVRAQIAVLKQVMSLTAPPAPPADSARPAQAFSAPADSSKPQNMKPLQQTAPQPAMPQSDPQVLTVKDNSEIQILPGWPEA